MENLRGWLVQQSDEELAALKDTPRFSTPRNRRILDTVLRERRGEQYDSWEDAINSKARSEEIQAAAQAILREHGFNLNDAVPYRELAPELKARVACDISTAKRHIVKAARILRGEAAQQWGGARDGAGYPKGKPRGKE